MMILVRDVFRIRFGMMKDALASVKQAAATFPMSGDGTPVRILTDLTGPYYTLVLESTHPTLEAYESLMKSASEQPAWHAWYDTFRQYPVDGHREMFTIAF